MKWRNHRLVTGTAVFLLTGHLLPAIIAVKGSVIPDAVEGNAYDTIEWKKNHRRLSHWWVLYLILLLPAAILLSDSLYFYHNLPWLSLTLYDIPDLLLPSFAFILFWLGIGSLFHIAEDSLCGKVPFLSPNHRVGIRCFYVGTDKEYKIAGYLAISFLLCRLFLPVPFFQGL